MSSPVGTQREASPFCDATIKRLFHTQIYRYLLFVQQTDLAQQFRKVCPLEEREDAVCGPWEVASPFLLEWWSLFWETYQWRRNASLQNTATVNTPLLNQQNTLSSSQPNLSLLRQQQQMIWSGTAQAHATQLQEEPKRPTSTLKRSSSATASLNKVRTSRWQQELQDPPTKSSASVSRSQRPWRVFTVPTGGQMKSVPLQEFTSQEKSPPSTVPSTSTPAVTQSVLQNVVQNTTNRSCLAQRPASDLKVIQQLAAAWPVHPIAVLQYLKRLNAQQYHDVVIGLQQLLKGSPLADSFMQALTATSDETSSVTSTVQNVNSTPPSTDPLLPVLTTDMLQQWMQESQQEPKESLLLQGKDPVPLDDSVLDLSCEALIASMDSLEQQPVDKLQPSYSLQMQTLSLTACTLLNDKILITAHFNQLTLWMNHEKSAIHFPLLHQDAIHLMKSKQRLDDIILYSASKDLTVRVWQFTLTSAVAQSLAVMGPLPARIHSLDVHPSRHDLIAMCDEHGTYRLWLWSMLGAVQCVHTLHLGGAASLTSATVLDAPRLREARFEPVSEGQRIAIASGQHVYVIGVVDCATVHTFALETTSTENQVLMHWSYAPYLIIALNRTLQVYCTDTWQKLFTLSLEAFLTADDTLECLLYHSSEDLIIFSTKQGLLGLWYPLTGVYQCHQEFQVHFLFGKGNHVAVACANGQILFFDHFKK